MKQQKLILQDLEDMYRFASMVAESARVFDGPCMIHLSGDLGAGKTTFCQYFIETFGYQGHVSSPSYALVNTYATQECNIAHADFYRLDEEDSLDLIGWDMVCEESDILLIEWPVATMSEPDMLIQFAFSESIRSVTWIQYS
ncbi:tRNA (adenosine(37)-N6)-threonylcarbamoyltransferase complex ATPase subunit type 1 TsaE [Candidatus Synchoanobacter obligatus]|uniref:tRNA threonylcarbamoyladenosine biosynthesis protein TsaE n=1 Tax=Candidatus Synchoanobacter obligatus TaxID=2919597 RepID=A0ABT1L3I1_9GAMM|nr:tRNA (adenosine(37)-N6)-threonylcarbamoyltransferase complex ATPase subunit type 1 TsaE [Candidatus Synchoanobacter obligatus]MCP8351774.1 tRNA (adenosine(37)-N6)-threonylcarbamoyltransferase complex ATPase subunit type 1 TsaE [Candidatus Synchoanobacter obligatus]